MKDSFNGLIEGGGGGGFAGGDGGSAGVSDTFQTPAPMDDLLLT